MIELPKWKTVIMALKRKRSSTAQVYEYDSHQSTSSTSSTDAAENHQPVSVGEENEMPMRKMRRMDSFVKLHYCDWSGSSDQITSAEDSLEDHGPQEPLSSGLEVFPPADQQGQTPSAVFHKWFKSVSEESDSQERQWRKYSSVELRSLHWISSSGQGQTTAAISERHAEDETKRTYSTIGRKRKSSQSAQVCDFHQSTSSTSSHVAENHQPASDGEENEMPMRKRRRMGSFEKLPSLHWNGSSDQDNTVIYERHTEGAEEAAMARWTYQHSLQDSACALEDHGSQESLSSGLEVLPPADQQVETLPVSPAPGHSNNRVDGTTEDNILSRYEIGRMLGEGSYGSVFEGKRLEDGLEVAVKIARKPKNMKYIYTPGHPAQLPLEVGLLILVNDGPKVPEIIELLDWQDQPDQYIMVLERPSPCTDMWDFLNFHDGTLNEDTARFIMTQTTMAAYMCCRRGVFHRDIKLENLLINTETHEVKLIDFGCGDLLRESGYEKFSGTLDYRPPEYRAEGKYHGKPATVWSLGVLLFLLVCGRYPEPRDRRMIDDNSWSMPGLSNECCHLIRSLLQESPRQRIDLRKILQHEWFKDTE